MGGWLILNKGRLLKIGSENPSNEMKVKESDKGSQWPWVGIRRSRDKMIKT